jgi:hypothetical protein
MEVQGIEEEVYDCYGSNNRLSGIGREYSFSLRGKKGY